jgi:hypothetical protein
VYASASTKLDVDTPERDTISASSPTTLMTGDERPDDR